MPNSTETPALTAEDLEAARAHRFPIIDGPSVLWSVIEPHEYQAIENHGQTLQRLAERGGLGSLEAWAVVNGWNLRRGMAASNEEGRERWRAFVLASENEAALSRARAEGARQHAKAVKASVDAELEEYGFCADFARDHAKLDGDEPALSVIYARALVAALSTAAAPAAPPSPVAMLKDRAQEWLSANRDDGVTLHELREDLERLDLRDTVEGLLLAILKLIDDETGGGDGK